MRRVTLAILFSLAMSGCGLIVRGSDYLADAGQSAMDAAVDGDVPRDGELPPVDGEVPSDGGPDAGPPENRPPVASGVGLSDHAPFLGETLRAYVGPAYDPDGDGVATQLAWFKNGAPIAGATGAALELDPTMFAVGDEIHVELSTADGDGPGSTATSGVAVIGADDVTTWRNLLPPRGLMNVRAFDRARQRLLFWSQGAREINDHGLWEMQLVTSGTPRWVRVDERGTRPGAIEGIAIYDAENERILYYGGRIPRSSGPEDSTDALFALDLRVRGRETWSQISVSAPPGRQAASVALSADGSRAWIYGGLYEQGGSGGLRDDVWELDLADASFTLIASSTGAPVIGAALIHDPERNRLIRVGGGSLAGPDDPPIPDDEIGAIDLATGAYTELGELASPLLGASAVVEGDTAYVFFGITSTFAPSAQVLSLPLSDPTIVTPIAADSAPFAILPMAEPRAPFADGFVVGGQGFDDRNANFYELDPTVGSFTVLTAAGHDLPTPTMQAISRIDREGRMWIHGGRQGTRDEEDIPVPDYLWRIGQSDTFERVNLSPAPTGGSNDPRWGIVWDGSQEHPWPDIWQALGRTGTGYYGPEPVLLAGEGWRHLALAAGAPGPDERVGHALFPGGCAGPVAGVTRGNVIGVFGGEHRESSASYGDTWMLECELPSSGPPTNCAWSNSVIAGPISPPPRSWAASAIAGPDRSERNRLVWFFGGRYPSGTPLAEMWVLDNCVGPNSRGEWARGNSVDGTVPQARFGHSMSHVRVAPDAPETEPSTILMYGGGQDEDGRSNHPDVWRIVPAGPRDANGYPVRYEPVPTAGPAPIGRMFHVANWDHVQRRLLVYGGYAGERALDDLWELRIRP